MYNDFSRPYSSLESHRKLTVGNLKRCPLCHTVNARQNAECFVCRWHGEFDHDPYEVEDGLMEMLDQCPELVDCILTMPKRRETFFEKVQGWFEARKRRFIDFEA